MKLAFKGTANRVSGSDGALASEMLRRHRLVYPDRDAATVAVLPNPAISIGTGDTHLWDPQSIANLQSAARANSEDAYWSFAKQVNDENTRKAPCAAIDFSDSTTSIDIDEVEAAAEIVKRFATGMSFGSISAEAHESLAIAMNRLGGKSNTGEGGEDAKRFIPLANGDSKRSAIKQIASGRFGVTINYLTNADELQIKIIQAKPGEGNELPGGKVDDYIAGLRPPRPALA